MQVVCRNHALDAAHLEVTFLEHFVPFSEQSEADCNTDFFFSLYWVHSADCPPASGLINCYYSSFLVRNFCPLFSSRKVVLWQNGKVMIQDRSQTHGLIFG